MVPVPMIDLNEAQSYTHLQVTKSYLALNSETYISLQNQELRMCKNICYEIYCKELFVVKHKSKYSCESAIYFDLGSDIIKENCYFAYYLMVEMKLFWQTGPIKSMLNVTSVMTFPLKYPASHMSY